VTVFHLVLFGVLTPGRARRRTPRGAPPSPRCPARTARTRGRAPISGTTARTAP